MKTYTYKVNGKTNKETFDPKGYITLYQDGLFKYEHQFNSFGLKIQEFELIKELNKRQIDYTIN